MKCPSLIKGKKKGSLETCGAELQTKRTLANGTKVRRERVCPKCHGRFWTIEQFEKDIEAAESQHHERIAAYEAHHHDMKQQISEYNNTLLGFKTLMEKAGKR